MNIDCLLSHVNALSIAGSKGDRFDHEVGCSASRHARAAVEEHPSHPNLIVLADAGLKGCGYRILLSNTGLLTLWHQSQLHEGIRVLLNQHERPYILQTQRLGLRPLTAHDAEFIRRLLNEPSFLQNIGDKRVRTTEDAIHYLQTGPIASYAKNGFGLWLVELKASLVSIGICGLLKRDTLPYVDIGYAFLPQFWSNGYAYESAAAVKEYGIREFEIRRLLAIVNHDNERSIKVLKKLGLRYERMIRLTGADPEVALYSWDA